MSSLAHSRRAKLVRIAYPSILFSFLFTPVCFIHPGTNLLCSFVADSKEFVLDLRVVHVRYLNFVLRSEIFVHTNGQLQASHLILGCVPVYKTWQPFSQDLLLDSPLLSYIDVRHANFLPPKLTHGEARDLGPRYITTKDLAPIRDESVECVT